MAVRQRKLVIAELYKQFKEFGLPLDIEYKSYTSIVGPQLAVHPISIKRSFKQWKYAMATLKQSHPDLVKKPEPVKAPEPIKTPEPEKVSKPAARPTSKPSSLEALKAKSPQKKKYG